jgi:hypothetical protein
LRIEKEKQVKLGIELMSMLRLTNRFEQYLASEGHGVCTVLPKGGVDQVITFREAEFVKSLSPRSGRRFGGATSLRVAPEFDFSGLNRLRWDESIHRYFMCGPGRQLYMPAHLRDDDFPPFYPDLEKSFQKTRHLISFGFPPLIFLLVS